MGKSRLKVAICYDFDGTLAPGNMQEYDYIPQLQMKSKEFWRQVKTRAQEQEADEILSYMCLMIEKANADPSKGIKITKKAFADYATRVIFFKGVESWFHRINEYGKTQGLLIEHYIISSGIKEMIEGTVIAKEFKHIYASSFMYDQHGVAYWPALAVNYTTKTQFLFRINKGILNVWDNTKINEYLDKKLRPIPFKRMIYIGDGYTDVPCMRLVTEQEGHSISVYQPNSTKKKQSADRLLEEGRVKLVAPANYQENSKLDMQVKALLNKIAAESVVETLEDTCNKKQ